MTNYNGSGTQAFNLAPGGHEKLLPQPYGAGYSIASEGHPDHNDDRERANNVGKRFLLADGMGGNDGSEAAAVRAIDDIDKAFDELPNVTTDEEADRKARSACLTAQGGVNEENEKLRQQYGFSDIGTTFVGMQFYEVEVPNKKGNGTHKEQHAMVFHAGDSRAYMYRAKENGAFGPLTQDHSGAKGQSRRIAWDIQAELSNAETENDITDEHAGYWATRNGISSSIGGSKEPLVDTKPVVVAPGDVFLLESDGIHDFLTDKEIRRVLKRALKEGNNDPAFVSQALVEAARERSHDKSHFRVSGFSGNSGNGQSAKSIARGGAKGKDDMTALVVIVPEV